MKLNFSHYFWHRSRFFFGVAAALLLTTPFTFWATAKHGAPAPEPAPRAAAPAPAPRATKAAMAAVNINPFLDCVDVNADGTFTAYFGYESFEDAVVTVQVGIVNDFVPNPADRDQPILFSPGLHERAFRITSSGPLAWNFNGFQVFARASSRPCTPPPAPPVVADITPFVENVTVNATTNEATATFGYYNGAGSTISLASGDPHNRLLYGNVPAVNPPTLPGSFLPGLNRNAFSVTFPSTSALTWQVQGIPALAVPGTCPNISVRVR